MKKTSFRNSVALIAIMFLAWLNPSLASAQQKISDKEIVGVWVMTSMMYEGEIATSSATITPKSRYTVPTENTPAQKLQRGREKVETTPT